MKMKFKKMKKITLCGKINIAKEEKALMLKLLLFCENLYSKILEQYRIPKNIEYVSYSIAK